MTVVFILLLATLVALTPPRFRWPIALVYSVIIVAFLLLDSCYRPVS